MIDQRNKLRAEKMFKDADNLRNKIFELYDVELTDHSMYTSWKKRKLLNLIGINCISNDEFSNLNRIYYVLLFYIGCYFMV